MALDLVGSKVTMGAVRAFRVVEALNVLEDGQP